MPHVSRFSRRGCWRRQETFSSPSCGEEKCHATVQVCERPIRWITTGTPGLENRVTWGTRLKLPHADCYPFFSLFFPSAITCRVRKRESGTVPSFPEIPQECDSGWVSAADRPRRARIGSIRQARLEQRGGMQRSFVGGLRSAQTALPQDDGSKTITGSQDAWSKCWKPNSE